MRRIVTLSFSGAAFFAGFGAGKARACDCDPVPPESSPQDAAPTYDALFFGELIDQECDFVPSSESANSLRWLKFKVLRSWKGVTGTEVLVLTEAGGSFAGCGFWGEAGNWALILARTLPDGSLEVPVCTWLPESYGGREHIEKLDEIGVPGISLTSGLDTNFAEIDVPARPCGTGIFEVCPLAALGLLVQRFVRTRRRAVHS